MLYCTSLDKQWHILDVKKPLYWDNEQRIYQYPTAYSDSSGAYIQSISYNEAQRQWIYGLSSKSDTGISLDIVSYPRGIPLWLGKPEGPYTIYGVTEYKQDIVTWGGFFDVGYFSAQFRTAAVIDSFYGGFLYDRAYHRVYFNNSAQGTGAEDGIVPTYSYIGIQQEEFVLMVAQNEKPPDCPVDPPVSFLRQGRINFSLADESYTFDNFTYEDIAYVDTMGLQPKKQTIQGSYEAGVVNITGEAFKFWPPQWWVYKGTYWDSTLHYSWGRGYYVWDGYITFHGDTIKLKDCFGGGEFTRHQLHDVAIKSSNTFSNKTNPLRVQIYSNTNGHQMIIDYHLVKTALVSLKVYDIRGRQVTAWIQAEKSAGKHSIQVNKDNLPNGTYIIAFTALGCTVKKVMIKLD